MLKSDAWYIFLCLLEIERVEKGETEKDTESYLDLFTQKNIKLKERVLIPVKQYPKVSVTMVFWNTLCRFTRLRVRCFSSGVEWMCNTLVEAKVT